MKYIKSLAVAAMALTATMSSCDMGDFGDINANPNKPSEAYTDMLYTYSAQWVRGFTMNSSSYDPWMQLRTGYLSESKNNQYGGLTNTVSFGTASYYYYYIKNLNTIIERNTNEETKSLLSVTAFGDNANQIAVSRTLRAFYFMTLTDILGPLPYSEAFKGESDDIWSPKYDSQESIYAALDADLVEAYSQFNEGGSLSSAEILYDGDISKWKKFNATLRMMMAIKMADVDPTNGKARFAKAYADGGMTEVEDGFHYTFDASNADYSAWMYYVGNMNYASRGENFVPNNFIVEALKEYNDPRMFSYFTLDGYKGKAEGDPSDINAYKGVPFGFASNPEVVSAAEGCASVNATYCDAGATYGLITTARALLVEAEAAVLGWINADPKELYEAGIKASFDFQAKYHTAVTKLGGETAVEDYLASEKIALSSDKETALEQIVMQRFLAGFMTDAIETWSDWRRYNVPAMPLTDHQIKEGNIAYPYRMTYDPSEKEANADNVEAAINEWLGGQDGLWTRVWWDVADNH